MKEPPFLCDGNLTPAPGEARQDFKLYRLSEDAVELRWDASDGRVRIQVERLAGYEVKRAIEKKLGGMAKVDYAKLGF